MTLTTPKIKSVTVKLKTDRPVKKTPYQVKGVLMRNFPNDGIVPMLNGSYRKKFLYPRIQVKIVDEEILLVGLHQGVDPILAIHEKINDLNFGDITFEVLEKSVEESSEAFFFSSSLHRYRFLSNWVALNINTSKKYNTKEDEEKLQYLNDLIANNIVFIAREMGFELAKYIYSKINVTDINPIKLDQNGWGAFDGEFYSNIVLPSYIGIGNGITRGYGTISGSQSNDILQFDNKEFRLLKSESENSHFSTETGNFSSTLESSESFFFSSSLHRYRFLSNWVALNINTSKKYNTKEDEEKLQYLNDLIANNIVFIAREMGFELAKYIYSKINVTDINPIKLDQNGWGAFDGEFYSNIVLPSYIGIGNGITRGYGTISGSQSNDILQFDNKEFRLLKSESENSHFSTETGNFSSTLFEVDVSAIQKPGIRKNKKKKAHQSKKKKKSFGKAKNSQLKKEKITKQSSDEPVNYNSYEYHKKQHSI